MTGITDYLVTPVTSHTGINPDGQQGQDTPGSDCLTLALAVLHQRLSEN